MKKHDRENNAAKLKRSLKLNLIRIMIRIKIVEGN